VLAAGRSSISAHRRSLVTATAAGAVLCALWFVPSAKATPDAPGTGVAPHAVTSSPASPQDSAATDSVRAGAASGTARPGKENVTAPFVLSALGLAGTGGFLIVRARRRAAAGASATSSQASSPVTD
jgi:hypothetical protein